MPPTRETWTLGIQCAEASVLQAGIAKGVDHEYQTRQWNPARHAVVRRPGHRPGCRQRAPAQAGQRSRRSRLQGQLRGLPPARRKGSAGRVPATREVRLSEQSRQQGNCRACPPGHHRHPDRQRRNLQQRDARAKPSERCRHCLDHQLCLCQLGKLGQDDRCRRSHQSTQVACGQHRTRPRARTIQAPRRAWRATRERHQRPVPKA